MVRSTTAGFRQADVVLNIRMVGETALKQVFLEGTTDRQKALFILDQRCTIAWRCGQAHSLPFVNPFDGIFNVSGRSDEALTL